MKVVILGTAHGKNVVGKRSPDGNFEEFSYSRKVIKRLKTELEAEGYIVKIDIADDIVPLPQAIELRRRCSIVNDICRKYGSTNCVYVSIHVNAAGDGAKWMNAGGWCAYTTKGKTKSDVLAEKLYDAAEKHLVFYNAIMTDGKRRGLYGENQRPIRTDMSDGDRDHEANFYVLSNTACAAVLTENLFMDNRSDMKYLESEEGCRAIVELHKEGIINYFKL